MISQRASKKVDGTPMPPAWENQVRTVVDGKTGRSCYLVVADKDGSEPGGEVGGRATRDCPA